MITTFIGEIFMNVVPLTIKETFEQDFFQDEFDIVAGKGGLNHTIDSVSVMEVADFIHFDLGENLFVLTTFSFCKTGNCDMIDTFRALVQKNISGILVKLNRFFDSLPDVFYAIADEYNVPVITTTSDVPFRDIINRISTNIISSQMDTIMMMNDMYKNLYSSLINNHSVERYIDLLNIPKDTYFYVKLDDTIVYESTSGSDLEIDQMTKKIEHINVDSRNSSKQYDSYYKVVKEDKELLVFPIGGINNSSGRIVVDETDHSIPNILIMAFTQLASYLSIKLTEHRLSQEERINNNSRIYSDLIESTNMTHDRALNLLHLGGYGNFPVYRILHISIDVVSNSAFDILKNRYAAIFNEENDQRFISLHSNGFSIIYGKRSSMQKDDDMLNDFIDRLHQILKKEKPSYRIGVSQPFNDYAKIRIAHNQAKQTTQISAKIREFQDVTQYEDIWEVDMLRILNNAPQIANLEEKVIQPLIEYDQTHQLDLIGTLGESIQTDSLKDVANNLFIHSTTLRYRYERIEQITGYNFLTNKGKFVLTCAYFVLMLNH